MEGVRPKMPLEMLTDFKGHLASLKIQELEQERQKRLRYYRLGHYNNNDNKTTTSWIGNRFLQTGIPEYRKLVV